MTSAFAYLVVRSAANRLRHQASQLRSPRYALALALGLAYLWYLLLDRPARAAPPPALSATLELLAAVGVAGAVVWVWLFGHERRALAFSPAEVTFLFPAPVRRRDLVQLKLLRMQLLILFNTVLWTVILARGETGAAAGRRAVAIWIVLTTLALHRLGASFTRATLAEHGLRGARRRMVSLVLLGVGLAAVVASTVDALPPIRAGWAAGLPAFFDAVVRAAERPVPAALLLPFRLLVRPLSAPDAESWLATLGPALVMLLAHYLWVIRSDTAFEEAALDVSLARARRAAERRDRSPLARAPGGEDRSPPLVPLGARGRPAAAIAWKNIVALIRRRRVRRAGLAYAAAAIGLATLSTQGSEFAAELIGALLLVWTAFAFAIGPLWIRNDLRDDLRRLDLLRSYPLTGASIVGAEVAGSTVTLTVAELALALLTWCAFLGNTSLDLTLAERTLALAAAAVLLPWINLLGMTIQNGAVLLYPAWARIGVDRPGGVEALGQNVLLTVAFVVLLGAALTPPALVAGGVWWMLVESLGVWTVVPAAAAGVAATMLEVRLAQRWLGRVFDGLDASLVPDL